jgi:hypothetical protein
MCLRHKPHSEGTLKKETRMKNFVWSLVILAACTCCAGASDEVFLLSYFKSNGETGVFLACSEDGRTFGDLNDGRAIFTPPAWEGRSASHGRGSGFVGVVGERRPSVTSDGAVAEDGDSHD